MTSLTLLFVVAAIAFAIARWLRWPEIPLLLGGGILLAAFGLTPSGTNLQSLVSLGLTFLVFSAGIELNPERIRAYSRAVIAVSLTQFTLVGLGGYLTARFFGQEIIPSLYLGFALATSSTLVVLRHLKQRQQRFEPFGRMVLGTLLIQDLIMIVVIILLVCLPDGPAAVATGIGNTLILAVAAFACQRWIIPALITRSKFDEELLLLTILTTLFVFVGLIFHMELPTVVGAFFAGFAFSAFPVNGLVRGVLNSLSDFFLAVFFTGLGAMLVVPKNNHLLMAILLAAIVVVLTPPIVTVVAEWHGYTSRAAIDSGLLLAQNSEFSLVLGLAGLGFGHISAPIFSVIALVTVTTMILTPFLATDRMTRRLLRLHPLRHRLETKGAMSNHVLLLGFGAGGMWVIKPLLNEHYQVLVVDDDPAVIDQLQNANIPCIRGDGSDEKILQKSGARQARLILASMRRAEDAQQVLRHVDGRVPVFIRVFDQRHAEHIRRLGGIPILNAIAAAETFMEWFDKAGFADTETNSSPESRNHHS